MAAGAVIASKGGAPAPRHDARLGSGAVTAAVLDTDTPRPTPAFHAMVFRILRLADTHYRPASLVSSHLTETLTDMEAAVLPAAIRNVLPLISGDADKLRTAMTVAADLDLHELADEAVRLAAETGDARIAVLAACLCGNPAADPAARRALSDAHPDDPMIQIRIDSHRRPGSIIERDLRLRSWPGLRSPDKLTGLLPVAVIDCDLPAAYVLRLAAALRRHRVPVLRLPRDVAPPDWFGPETVYITSDAPPGVLARRLSAGRTICVAVGSVPQTDRTVEMVAAALPPALLTGTRLRPPAG